MRSIVGPLRCAAIAFPALLAAPEARSESAPTAAELAAQIQALKDEYAARIEALEARLAGLKDESAPAASARGAAPAADSAFNPAIGVVLVGTASHFSADDSEIPGFQLGHEGERGDEALSLGHTEAMLSSNVDDKFYGNVTLGFDSHRDEPVVELEEAFIQTLPGAGLPDGARIKAGRALWTFGYLNEQHVHGDDFTDRPLPYRVYLDNAYNDDGLEFSWVLPTEMYGEIGGGLFRGDDLPFGGSDDGLDAWSTYARLGGDIGRNSAWRIGAYLLSGEARNRGGGAHAHDAEEHEDRAEDHDEDHDEGHAGDHDEDHDENAGEETHADFFSSGMFSGDSRLWGIDVRYTWAPTGNAQDSELILQGEYFRRQEDGEYRLTEVDEDGEEVEHAERLDGASAGWYAQAVYKFLPRWRAGVRYAQVEPPRAADLDHTPYAISVMGDWTNSEFGRVRLQYNRESPADGERDDQALLQYIMSLGAHPAHTF